MDLPDIVNEGVLLGYIEAFRMDSTLLEIFVMVMEMIQCILQVLEACCVMDITTCNVHNRSQAMCRVLSTSQMVCTLQQQVGTPAETMY